MSIQISVVIPAFNAQSTIRETLESVFSQTYPSSALEVIVIDDGSTDDTNKILEQYGDKVIHIKQSNQGVAAARNNAAKLASGCWLAFIDADDLWHPEKLTTQMRQIGEHLWSHTDSYYFGFNQSGNTKRSDYTAQYDGNVFERLVLDNFITTSTVVVDKTLFLDLGGFDESLPALEDWKLWLDISVKSPLHYCSEPMTRYRVTPGSTSRKARYVLPLHLTLINRVFTENKLTNSLKKKAKSQSYTICSYIAEDSGDYIYAIYCSALATLEDFNLKKLRRLAGISLKQFKMLISYPLRRE